MPRERCVCRAAEIGLDAPNFLSPDGCNAVRATDAGFASNDAIVAHLRSRCPRCFEPGALLCHAETIYEEEKGIAYSRLPEMNCFAVRMPIERGQAYTAISFLGPPPADLNLTFYDEPHRAFYPMHTHWKMWYSSTDPDAEHQNGVYPLLHAGEFNLTVCAPEGYDHY